MAATMLHLIAMTKIRLFKARTATMRGLTSARDPSTASTNSSGDSNRTDDFLKFREFIFSSATIRALRRLKRQLRSNPQLVGVTPGVIRPEVDPIICNLLAIYADYQQWKQHSAELKAAEKRRIQELLLRSVGKRRRSVDDHDGPLSEFGFHDAKHGLARRLSRQRSASSIDVSSPTNSSRRHSWADRDGKVRRLSRSKTAPDEDSRVTDAQSAHRSSLTRSSSAKTRNMIKEDPSNHRWRTDTKPPRMNSATRSVSGTRRRKSTENEEPKLVDLSTTANVLDKHAVSSNVNVSSTDVRHLAHTTRPASAMASRSKRQLSNRPSSADQTPQPSTHTMANDWTSQNVGPNYRGLSSASRNAGLDSLPNIKLSTAELARLPAYLARSPSATPSRRLSAGHSSDHKLSRQTTAISDASSHTALRTTSRQASSSILGREKQEQRPIGNTLRQLGTSQRSLDTRKYQTGTTTYSELGKIGRSPTPFAFVKSKQGFAELPPLPASNLARRRNSTQSDHSVTSITDDRAGQVAIQVFDHSKQQRPQTASAAFSTGRDKTQQVSEMLREQLEIGQPLQAAIRSRAAAAIDANNAAMELLRKQPPRPTSAYSLRIKNSETVDEQRSSAQRTLQRPRTAYTAAAANQATCRADVGPLATSTTCAVEQMQYTPEILRRIREATVPSSPSVGEVGKKISMSGLIRKAANEKRRRRSSGSSATSDTSTVSKHLTSRPLKGDKTHIAEVTGPGSKAEIITVGKPALLSLGSQNIMQKVSEESVGQSPLPSVQSHILKPNSLWARMKSTLSIGSADTRQETPVTATQSTSTSASLRKSSESKEREIEMSIRRRRNSASDSNSASLQKTQSGSKTDISLTQKSSGSIRLGETVSLKSLSPVTRRKSSTSDTNKASFQLTHSGSKGTSASGTQITIVVSPDPTEPPKEPPKRPRRQIVARKKEQVPSWESLDVDQETSIMTLTKSSNSIMKQLHEEAGLATNFRKDNRLPVVVRRTEYQMRFDDVFALADGGSRRPQRPRRRLTPPPDLSDDEQNRKQDNSDSSK